MQEVRLRQARRHREALRAMQSKSAAILERPQESRWSSRWRPPGCLRRRETKKEVKKIYLSNLSITACNGPEIFPLSSRIATLTHLRAFENSLKSA